MKVWALLVAFLAVACNRGGPQTKEAVRLGVVEHLSSKSGLDISSMDIEVASVSFRSGEADALVSFRPKGSIDPGAGMQMKYTLESKGGKWVVKGRAEAAGKPHSGAAAQPGGSELPPGHPPVNAPAPGQKK